MNSKNEGGKEFSDSLPPLWFLPELAVWLPLFLAVELL